MPIIIKTCCSSRNLRKLETASSGKTYVLVNCFLMLTYFNNCHLNVQNVIVKHSGNNEQLHVWRKCVSLNNTHATLIRCGCYRGLLSRSSRFNSALLSSRTHNSEWHNSALLTHTDMVHPIRRASNMTSLVFYWSHITVGQNSFISKKRKQCMICLVVMMICYDYNTLLL